MITKQEIMRQVELAIIRWDREGTTRAVIAATAADAIMALLPQWVSTDDRKPRLNQRVLAIDIVAGAEMEIDWQTEGSAYGPRCWASGVYRTHWQPLPAPPEVPPCSQ